jgi:MarR family transcriptional regulator, transcriptional regulator for hemolysin
MSVDRYRNFGFLIGSVYRLYTRLFERHSIELGLTLVQCKVLGFLSRNEGASQARIAEGTSTDPMTLVRILDRMEQDGWIERRLNADDRRAHRLYLQEAAKPVLNKMWRVADVARSEALHELDPAAREQFLQLLEQLNTRLLALDAVATRPVESPDSSSSPKPARSPTPRS